MDRGKWGGLDSYANGDTSRIGVRIASGLRRPFISLCKGFNNSGVVADSRSNPYYDFDAISAMTVMIIWLNIF